MFHNILAMILCFLVFSNSSSLYSSESTGNLFIDQCNSAWGKDYQHFFYLLKRKTKIYKCDELYKTIMSKPVIHLSFRPEYNSVSNYFFYNKSWVELPSSIGLLTNLYELDLSGTYLTKLPPEIGNLKNLHSLNLESSKIESLPPEIGNLKNLYYLNMESSNIKTLPHEIGNLRNLHVINISVWIKNLPPEFKNLKNLRFFIEHRNNKLDDVSVKLLNDLGVHREIWY